MASSTSVKYGLITAHGRPRPELSRTWSTLIIDAVDTAVHGAGEVAAQTLQGAGVAVSDLAPAVQDTVYVQS